MTFIVHHVAVMSFNDFGKMGEGVQHHFLKIGADVVHEMGEMGCY